MIGEILSIETAEELVRLKKRVEELEQINEEHRRINGELREENKRLKELCDKYEEEHNTAFKLWIQQMKEIPTYEEKKDLKYRINKAIEYVENENTDRFNNPTYEFALELRKNKLLEILKGKKWWIVNKEDINELLEYNNEYMEAQISEEIFGGDYTSAVELKYAQQELDEYKNRIDKAIEYIKEKSEEVELNFYGFPDKITSFRGSVSVLLNILQGSDE